MAISKEALTYLHELEKLEKWTDIPNDDKRIVKLRKLFDADYEDKPRAKQRKISQIKVSIKGVELHFASTKECAEAFGFNVKSLRSNITKGLPYKGISFQIVEE